MEKKSNKGIIIALCTVIVLLIGGFTYLFVSGTVSFKEVKTKCNAIKIDDKDENKKEEIAKDDDTDNEEELSLDDYLVYKLYEYTSNDSYVNEYFCKNENLTNKTVSDEIKLEIAFNENIGHYNYSYYNPSEIEGFLGTHVYSLDANIVVNQIEEIFGKDNGYKHVSEPLHMQGIYSCGILKYNSKKGVYEIYTSDGCGDATAYVLYNKFSKAIKTKDSIILTEKMYVVSGFGVYKDFAQTKLIEANVTTDYQDNEKYYEQGATVTYTFKLAEDGSYYFDNSKITY